MKIALASDLHLEFGDINLTNTEGADVLILAGDIMVAQDLHDHPDTDSSEIRGPRHALAYSYRNFLKRCSSEFPHVIYIAGNHEFYRGKIHGSLDDLYNECAKYSNVYFLEDQTKVIDDITFIGCTLWTDMNKSNPLTMEDVARFINDYHSIRNETIGYRKLRPETTLARHYKSLKYITSVVDKRPDEKFIVVGHHAPSSLSILDEYVNDFHINGAYCSDLSEFILNNPQIKVWFHGHTHHEFDYIIGDTRIVCNPRGYAGYEMRANKFKLKYIEV